MKKFLLILLAAASVLSSCAGYKQIDLEDVQMKSFKMSALTSADVTFALEVNNPTKSAFKIDGAEGIVYKDGVEFARISQVKDGIAVIEPGTPAHTDITLRVWLTDPFSAVSGGFNPKSWKLDNFKADATVWVKKGKFSKKLKFKDMPVKELVEKLQ